MSKKEKIVIITGGLGFLGSFFCQELIKKKFKVIILDIKKPKTSFEKNLVKKCFIYESLDITSEQLVQSFFKKLIKKKIYSNYLINNAAIDSVPKISEKNSHLPSVNNWNSELAVSLTGSYLMI